jgi:hypothetical protein
VGWPNSDDSGPVSDVSSPRVIVLEPDAAAAPLEPEVFPLEEQADRVRTQASANPAIHRTLLNAVDFIDMPFL